MMEIFGQEIGPDRPTYFIAEIGANHDGELDRALKLIELAADSGADAVKFQHFEASTIVSRRGFEELDGKLAHQAGWEKSVYEVYEDASIPMEWTEHLSSYAHDHGIAFITTPYSLELVDAVEPYVDAYKIGSGDVTYLDLIAHVARKGKPVLLATGAASEDEVSNAYNVAIVRSGLLPSELILMQCNTDYSGDHENLRYSNLRTIAKWRDRYYYSLVGLSDHTPSTLAVNAAIALGAKVIEKHFTDDPHRVGPDHGFAITPFEWRRMVADARALEEAIGDGVKRVEENEKDARIVQRRALRWTKDLSRSHIVEAGDLVATRPCPPGALLPAEADRVVGHILKVDVYADALVQLKEY